MIGSSFNSNSTISEDLMSVVTLAPCLHDIKEYPIVFDEQVVTYVIVATKRNVFRQSCKICSLQPTRLSKTA